MRSRSRYNNFLQKVLSFNKPHADLELLGTVRNTMDRKTESITLSVHRCRFVDYSPSAITALAYPPLRLPSIKGKKSAATGKTIFRFGLLAVGHANGNIDICEWAGGAGAVQCSQAWVVRKACKLSGFSLLSPFLKNISDTFRSLSFES